MTADAALAEFVPRFARQANADDPTTIILGYEHSDAVPGDPVDDAIMRAVATAMMLHCPHAMQRAASYALGTVVATFLLVFAQPKGKAQDEKGVIAEQRADVHLWTCQSNSSYRTIPLKQDRLAFRPGESVRLTVE